jgi:hypothetical protein
MRRLVAAATLALLGACFDSGSDLFDPPIEPDDPPPDDPPVTRISVTIADLQPGWRITTSRLTDADAPDEATLVSDGTPITLEGTDHDVFFATVTDELGQLVATHAMKSPCTLAAGRRLDVPREYPTIQAAVDAADPGDTVRVAAGEYTESVVMRAGVCLLGSGAKRTILDASGQGRRLVDLSAAPGSVVSGFTFRRTAPSVGCANQDPFTCSGDWYTAGVFVGGTTFGPTVKAPPTIVNNVFESNYIGVMLNFHGIAVVRNNIFVGNRNGLVANHFQDRSLIANNVFVDNTELAIGNQAAYLDIIDNIIVRSPIGIRFAHIQTGHIRCNVFFGNGANQSDIHLVPPRFTIGVNGNVEADPHFLGNGDYHLSGASPAKGAGCHGNQVAQPVVDGSSSVTLPDIGAYGGPLAAWAEL